MAVDVENHYMVTGDVDGLVKVWDIAEYCITKPESMLPVKTLPGQ